MRLHKYYINKRIELKDELKNGIVLIEVLERFLVLALQMNDDSIHVRNLTKECRYSTCAQKTRPTIDKYFLRELR